MSGGSKFTINLPMANPHEPPQPPPVHPSEALLQFQAQYLSPTSGSLGSSLMLPTGLLSSYMHRERADATLASFRIRWNMDSNQFGIAGKGRYSRAMRAYVTSPSSAPITGVDSSSPSHVFPRDEALSPHVLAENRARRAQAQEMERTRLEQLGFNSAPRRDSVDRSPLSMAVDGIPPTALHPQPRTPSHGSGSLALPALNFYDPAGRPDPEDDEKTFQRKLTTRYDTQDSSLPELPPPVAAAPNLHVRNMSDRQLEQHKLEHMPRAPLQTIPPLVSQQPVTMLQSALRSDVVSSRAVPAAAAAALFAMPPQPPLSKATTAPGQLGRCSAVKGKYDHIRLMVVDDSEINKKLFLRLLSMEGFTNVETAAHGLEAVEKLTIFREQSLARWKKWMEIHHGDQSKRQHFEDFHELPDEEADDIRRRISSEAQVLTQALLVELGVAGSQYATLSERERMTLLAQAANQMVSREKMTLTEDKLRPTPATQDVTERFAALNIEPIPSPPPDPADVDASVFQPVPTAPRAHTGTESTGAAAAGSKGSAPETSATVAASSTVTVPDAVASSGRPVASLTSPVSILAVPCRYSPLLPKLIFLDLHMPLLDGFQTALAIRKLGFDMPIAALTASVGTSDQRMAEQLGFARYITKPISRPQLKEVLQLAMEQLQVEAASLEEQAATGATESSASSSQQNQPQAPPSQQSQSRSQPSSPILQPPAASSGSSPVDAAPASGSMHIEMRPTPNAPARVDPVNAPEQPSAASAGEAPAAAPISAKLS